uniref:hypothetical protein n=1 Tax=Endozoicomonas sp. ONNA2 TaxID=2828741 RepID=UPI002148903A
AGKNEQTIINTQVINSNITTKNRAAVEIEPDVICNVRIDKRWLTNSSLDQCEDLQKKVCLKIVPSNSPLCQTNNHEANLTPTITLTTLSSNTSGLNFTPSATPTPPVNGFSSNISLPGTSLAPFTTPAPPPISLAAILSVALGAGVVLLAGAAVACCCYHRRQKSLTRADSPDWNGRTSPDGSNQFMSEVGSPDWTGPTPPDLTHRHHPLWPLNQAITGNNIPMETFGKEPDQPIFPDKPDIFEPDQPMYLNQSDMSEPDQPIYLNQSDTSEPDQPMYLNQSDTSEPDQPMYLNQPSRSRPAPRTFTHPCSPNRQIWRYGATTL